MKRNMRELFDYILVGGLTTGVNYFCYFGLYMLNKNWLFANSLAWLAAVIFAFYANKYYVFKSHGQAGQEMLSFFGLRFLTLLVENTLLYVCIDLLLMGGGLSKILVSFITVLSNYYLCKLKVFKKEKEVYE